MKMPACLFEVNNVPFPQSISFEMREPDKQKIDVRNLAAAANSIATQDFGGLIFTIGEDSDDWAQEIFATSYFAGKGINCRIELSNGGGSAKFFGYAVRFKLRRHRNRLTRRCDLRIVGRVEWETS